MSKNVWLITAAGRGMGVDFARAALASGHSVVASGRDRERVSMVLGTASDLLAVKLDVTSAADAEAAVRDADLKEQIDANRTSRPPLHSIEGVQRLVRAICI